MKPINKIKIPVFIGMMILASSCQTYEYLLQTSVPEEGGASFVRISDEDENVFGTRVANLNNRIYWDASRFICLDTKGDNIYYTSDKGEDNRNIFSRSVTSGRTIQQKTFKYSVFYPSVNPENDKISFTDFSEGNANINLMNLNEGVAVQQIAVSEFNETGPIFSTDGKQIYFTKAIDYQIATTPVRTVSYNYNGYNIKTEYWVWSIDLNTSIVTQLCKGIVSDIINDHEILLTRANTDTYKAEIWKVNIKTGAETLILRDKDRAFATPMLSPDGKTILCTGSTKENRNKPANLDLYTVKLDGSSLTQITFHPGHDFSGSWDPSGKAIYFVSQRGKKDGKFGLWKMNFVK